MGLVLPIALFAALASEVEVTPPNETRLAVAPFQGKGSPACTKAFADVAKDYAKIEPWKAKERPPVSWDALVPWLGARGKEIGADVVVLGMVQGQKLILEAYDPQRAKLIGLKRLTTPKHCKFTATSQKLVGDWLRRVVELRNEPEPSPEVIDAPNKTEVHEMPADLLGGEPVGQPKKPAEQTAAAVQVEKPAESGRGFVRPELTSLISAALELAIVSRSFSYDTPRTPNLRSYDIAGMTTPGIRIEARPFVREDPLLAPLFLNAFFRQSIGVKSARPDGGPSHPTDFLDAGAYAGYRFLLPQAPAAIAPRLGYRRTQFTVKPARDGQREEDLPNVAYSSVMIGGEGDYAVREWMSISASLSYLVLLSGGEVFSQAYFSGGSTLSFEIEAGLRFSLAPDITLSVNGAYQRFSLHFDAVKNAVRAADGAEDGMLAIRSVLRIDF